MSDVVPNRQLTDIQKLLEEAVKTLAKMAEPKDPKLTGFREPCDVPNLLKDPKWDEFVPGVVGPIAAPPLYYTVPGTAVPWWDSTQDTVLVKQSALNAKDEEVDALNREIDQRDAAMRNQKVDIERFRKQVERKEIIVKDLIEQNRELRVEKTGVEAQLRTVTKDKDKLTLVALSNAKARDEALEALVPTQKELKRHQVANNRLQIGRDEQERENNVLRARNEKLHDELGASSMELRDTVRKLDDANNTIRAFLDSGAQQPGEDEAAAVRYLKENGIIDLLVMMKDLIGEFPPVVTDKKENGNDS